MDGASDFDLCAYLGTSTVSLHAISQLAVAVNDVLTVWDSPNQNVEIYGPFKDTTGSGLIRTYRGNTYEPFIKGTEATAGSKVSFEVDYVKYNK
jgi:hypothetical protein